MSDKKKYYKYYSIQSCYERQSKETWENEVVLIVNEWKWKGILSSYTQWLTFTPEVFVKKFWSQIKNDEYNKWLSRKNLRCEIEIVKKNEEIVSDLPDDYR